MSSVHTFSSPRGLRAIARVLAALTESPKSRPELSEALHMGKTTAYRYIRHLQAEKRVYVHSYRRTEGEISPVYAAGSKEDAKPLQPRNRKQRRDREMELLRADHDRLDVFKSRKAVNGKLYKMRKTGKVQSWFSALI